MSHPIKSLTFLLFTLCVSSHQSIPIPSGTRQVWTWVRELEVPSDYVIGTVAVLAAYGTLVSTQFPVERMDPAGLTRSKTFLVFHITLCAAVLLSCTAILILDSARVNIRLIGRLWYKVQPHIVIVGAASVTALEATAASLQRNRAKPMYQCGAVGVVRAGQQFGIGIRQILGYKPAVLVLLFAAVITIFNLIGTYSAGAVLNSLLSIAGLLILISGAGIPTWNQPQRGDGEDTKTKNAVFGKQKEVNILGANFDTPAWLLLLENDPPSKEPLGEKRSEHYKLSSSIWGVANAHAAVTDYRVRPVLTHAGSTELADMIKSFGDDVRDVHQSLNAFYNADRSPEMETMLLLAGKAKFLDSDEFWTGTLTARQRLIEISKWSVRYQVTLRRSGKQAYISEYGYGSCRARWCYRDPLSETPEIELKRIFGSVGNSSFIKVEEDEDIRPKALWQYARECFGQEFGNKSIVLWIYIVYRLSTGSVTFERPDVFPVGSVAVPVKAAELLLSNETSDEELDLILRPCQGDVIREDRSFGAAPIPKALVHQGRQVLRKATIAQGIVFAGVAARELV